MTQDKEIVERIKKSAEKVGQIYPIILDINNQVVDGQHRKEADPNWKTQKRDDIKTVKDRLKVRLVSNHARKSSIPETWKEDLGEMAKQYTNEGLGPGEIGKEIAKETGLPYRTIMKYLPNEYKRSEGYETSVVNSETEVHECISEATKADIVEEPSFDIKSLFEIAKGVNLPRIQIKAFRNMPWTAIMVETKFMEELGKNCKKKNIDVIELMARALEYTKEKLE